MNPDARYGLSVTAYEKHVDRASWMAALRRVEEVPEFRGAECGRECVAFEAEHGCHRAAEELGLGLTDGIDRGEDPAESACLHAMSHGVPPERGGPELMQVHVTMLELG
jgi:hypothetical protein